MQYMKLSVIVLLSRDFTIPSNLLTKSKVKMDDSFVQNHWKMYTLTEIFATSHKSGDNYYCVIAAALYSTYVRM